MQIEINIDYSDISKEAIYDWVDKKAKGERRERRLKDKNGNIYHRRYLLKENKEFLKEQVEGYIKDRQIYRKIL